MSPAPIVSVDPRVRERVGQALFLALCGLQLQSFLASWLRTNRWPALVYAAITVLEGSLTVARRPPRAVTRSSAARALAGVGMFGPVFLRAGGNGWTSDWFAGTLIGGGLAVSVLALLSLARSFSIVPSNRGIVQGGAYHWIRHPVYAGYLMSHLGFLLAYPTLWNLFWVLLGDSAQIGRLLAEEQLLAEDATYRAYQARTRWRLIPWVF